MGNIKVFAMSDEGYDYGDEAAAEGAEDAAADTTAAADSGSGHEYWPNLLNWFLFYLIGGVLQPIGVLLAMFGMHTWFYDLMTGLDMYPPQAKSLGEVFNAGGEASADDSGAGDETGEGDGAAGYSEYY